MARKAKNRLISYELKLTCDMPEGINEFEFLNKIRTVLHDDVGAKFEDGKPKVSVMKRIETFKAAG